MHKPETVPTNARRLRPSVSALLLAVLTIASAPSAPGMTIDGIDIPETLCVGDHTLVLNRAGMREKMFVDAYVACLYLPESDNDPERILAADEPQAVIMHINSDLVTRKRLTAAVPRDLRRSTGKDFDSIRPQTEKLVAMIDGNVAAGDVFRFVYLPGEGTRVWHNDQSKGVLKGVDFKRALFGIWLSESPTQKSLKRDLLRGDRID